MNKFFVYALIIILIPFLLLPISVLTLRWVNPPVTTFTLLEDWNALEADRYNLRDCWTPGSEIPDHLKWAVVAAEDQDFYNHFGFDIESIKEAWEERRKGIRSRGASTISQQVAKNLYLWPAHSFFRKGLEAYITIFIELFWPKERILEMYLNIAEFGPGLFGIGKAADHYFGIDTAALEPEMAARMAAVLPSPKRMRPEPPTPHAKERSEWILEQMAQLTGEKYAPEPEIILQEVEIPSFTNDTLPDIPAPDTTELFQKHEPDSVYQEEPDTLSIDLF